MRDRLSYANVTATLALFVALGGSSYAALKLPTNSVGAKQLKSGSVGAKELKKGSVRSKQVSDKSLGLVDFKVSERSKLIGPQGPSGVAGRPGSAGSVRGYAHLGVVDASGPYYLLGFVGPHPGFASARSVAAGATCLKPDTSVLTLDDVFKGVLTDWSGNDTRLYFNGSFSCAADEARVVQKTNGTNTSTNQNFNVLVP
jgi:hypothetical protein